MYRADPRRIRLLVLAVLAVVAIPACTAMEPKELMALESIYHLNPVTMEEYGWNTNFIQACDESSSWNRTITCRNASIIEFSFMPIPGQKLTKFELSDAWGDFSKLESLTMVSLNATGTIPPSLGNLKHLSSLILAINDIEGTIPDLSGTNLSLIDMSVNGLEGSIPSWLFAMPNIKEIRLWDNWFTGSIPDSYWSPSIAHVILRENLLNGSIPSQAASTPLLKTLLLDNNRLSGTVPYRLFTAPIKSFTISFNMLDICSGLMLPQPIKLSVCSILPQYFNQRVCNCSEKWNSQCGQLPASCPQCAGSPPTPEFKCSTTEAGWWIEELELKSGQTADFRGTTSAIVLDSLVADPGSTIIFGFNSALQTRGSVEIRGAVQVFLTEADTVYLGNQLSGDLYHKSWLPVTKQFITSYTPEPEPLAKWEPEIDIPAVCHFITAKATSRPLVLPVEYYNLYTVVFQYQSGVRFRCSPWVIVIGVAGGVVIVGCVLFIFCYIYTKRQTRRQKMHRMPLLR